MTNCSQLKCFNFSFFDINPNMLPEIRSSAEVYGSLVDGPLKGTPISGVSLVGPNIKILVFKVTRPYLNLLIKPRFFFRFS